MRYEYKMEVLPGQSTAEAGELCNRLGAEGWRLVNTVFDPRDTLVLFFERPVL